MRLDQYLHAQSLAPSGERARALIMAGLVYVNGQKADKAGQKVPEGAEVEVRGSDHGYASRGGLKLEKALKVFPASPKGLVCMDVGASTGGFTDCLLQNGAARVYAVDVGYGQLAWSLRGDERVVVMERTNVRNLQPEDIPEPIDLFTVDVSFISLKHVLPVLAALGKTDCKVICLVKPQFEAGKDRVGKKGVVRDAAVHLQVLEDVAARALENGFAVKGLDYSPVKGPQGNIEYLMLLKKAEGPEALPAETAQRVCEAAHAALDAPAAAEPQPGGQP